MGVKRLRQQLREAFDAVGIVSVGFQDGSRDNVEAAIADLAPHLITLMQGVVRCRVCHKRIEDGTPQIATGASQLGEGCFNFHEVCYKNLSKVARATANKINSSFFYE